MRPSKFKMAYYVRFIILQSWKICRHSLLYLSLCFCLILNEYLRHQQVITQPNVRYSFICLFSVEKVLSGNLITVEFTIIFRAKERIPVSQFLNDLRVFKLDVPYLYLVPKRSMQVNEQRGRKILAQVTSTVKLKDAIFGQYLNIDFNR